MASKTVVINLMVDKIANRVIYAEAGGDFVDILFSFLTVPLGQIIKLLGKKSGIGCMDQLYESVEKTEPRYFLADACKSMLLSPRSTSELECSELAINVFGQAPPSYYLCSSCFTYCRFSMYEGTMCYCGQPMNNKKSVEKPSRELGTDEVFLKRNARFMITDSLQVLPVSTMAGLSLLKHSGIRRGGDTEEKAVTVGQKEILLLFKRLLVSKTPLSDVFLPSGEGANNFLPFSNIASACLPDKGRDIKNVSSKTLELRLLVSMSKDKILYAETSKDFLDLLLGFLTFPLGAIAQQLGGNSSLGCIDELYKSVQVGDHIKTEACKMKLVSPKLPPHFCSRNSPLQLNAESCLKYYIGRCACKYRSLTSVLTTTRVAEGFCCYCGGKSFNIIELCSINPRLPCQGTEGFMKCPAMFMVTDDLLLVPSSSIKGFELITKLNLSLDDVEERVISLGEKEALDLLKASVISKAALTEAFYQKSWKDI